jgi:anti-sigma factor RsiW
LRGRRRRPLPLPAEPECEHVAAVLQSYLDGELGPEDTDAVAGHLEHCERCGIEIEVTRKVIDAIQRQRPDLDREALHRMAGFVDELTGGSAPEAP